MKKYKIKFHDFFPNFLPKDYWIWKQLSKFYDLELALDIFDVDIFVYSVWSTYESMLVKNKILKNNPNCIRIFYTPENNRPNFDECDIAISFDFTDNPKNIRLPYYVIRTMFGVPEINLNRLQSNFKKNYQYVEKTKFCCTVVSRNNCKERNLFFEKLSKYKKVDSGGKYLNNIGYNIGGWISDKLNFIQNYKFVISFENIQYPGYTTEKIIEPMCVGSIPIYWGSTLIHKEFNTNSFINIYDIKYFDDAIDKIIEIDNNDNLFFNMQKDYNLLNDEIQDFQNLEFQLNKLKILIDDLSIKKLQ